MNFNLISIDLFILMNVIFIHLIFNYLFFDFSLIGFDQFNLFNY